MKALLTNQFLWVPLLAWAIGQLLKVLTDSWRQHRLSLRSLGMSGGMPSSHTALTVCLTTVVERQLGPGSPLFAVVAILTMVVVYDATGVRRAAGQQGVILNQVLDDLRSHLGFRYERLREFIGHTPFEVLAGVVLGIVVGLLL
ncbi:MAG TPA: divergent PAP2 family protein [Candidatus Dormibacteraeota bacterium]|nr:divergent PAP2 family protein [Candidatus Dormibacteraeota bacterium]